MKKTLTLAALLTISGTAHTATLVPGQTYDMNILADGISCFQYSGDCTAAAPGSSSYFIDNDNDTTVTSPDPVFGGPDDPNFGSSIAGDGLAGIINISTTSDGDGGVNFKVNTFNMETYFTAVGGWFASMARDPSTMSGNVDANGNITFDMTGRTSMFQYFNYNLDEIHNSASFTSGTQLYPSFLDISLSGSTLALDGSAVIVSSRGAPTGAVPEGWGIFGEGAPLTEVLSLEVVGGDIIPSPVPLPASVWLFGSGLLSVFGLARRKLQ